MSETERLKRLKVMKNKLEELSEDSFFIFFYEVLSLKYPDFSFDKLLDKLTLEDIIWLEFKLNILLPEDQKYPQK